MERAKMGLHCTIVSNYVDWCLFHFKIATGNDFNGFKVAVGPTADVTFGAGDFDPTTLPYLCTTITSPFSFPETRDITCDT